MPQQRPVVCLIALVSALILSGCGPARNKSPRPVASGEGTPKATFEKRNAALLKGDLKTAYELTASSESARVPFEQFCKDYQENKAVWELRVKGAVMTVCSIDDDGVNASGIIVFGDGLKAIVAFVKEDGVWHESQGWSINGPGGQ